MRALYVATLLTLFMLSACSGSSPPPLETPGAEGNRNADASSSAPATDMPTDLVPFVLPWDDGSDGVTNLSSLNHTPAGAYGFVRAGGDSQFVLENGDPIRFWGVNITAESSFPNQAEAEKIAARLAKFGINIVRFHHMDFGWSGPDTQSLIDYREGNSRHLHRDNLTRLDYFIYQLRTQGIYVNLNLLNSRFFYASDGLPEEVENLDWKGAHVLGFIDEHFRDLEKEFAQQLLTHTNPYTGLAYREDPAIVMVEVNNENSLFQQFYDGALDAWPDVFRDQLTGHWNAWLQARYANSEALEAAWDVVDEAAGDEMLSENLNDWVIEFHGGAAGDVSAGTFDGRSGWHWAVTTPGSDSWHAQFNQPGLTLTEDQVYTLRFQARADADLTVNATLQQAYGDYDTHLSRPIALGGQWQTYEWQFFAPVSDDNLRINFNGFGEQTADAYLSEISLRPGGSVGTLPPGESLSAGTVSANTRSGIYTRARMQDWAEFLRDRERDYWGDMRDYIKDTLSYEGLVAGTTIMNSPPSVQAQYDFADGHAYWQHPVFPGEPWDSSNWTVGSSAMVNTWNTTLSNLSRERIAGLPFTVSEYQHASPNPYSSEGPLLVAAYAALQDWDGIMMFAYDAPAGGWGASVVDNFFSMTAHPTKMANMLAGALIYRQGHVQPAQTQVLMNFSEGTELNILTTRGSSWNVANGSHLGVPGDLALRHRVALELSGTQGQDVVPAALTEPVALADTGELRWDRSRTDKGVVTIDTEHTKAVIGFIDQRTFELGGVTIAIAESQRDWATLSISARKGSFAQPGEPAHLLLVTTGMMENTDMQWNDAGTSVGNQWGQAPTRVEVIRAQIDLPYAADTVRAWALDEQGQRLSELTVSDHDGEARLQLGEQPTLWYEIVVAPE